MHGAISDIPGGSAGLTSRTGPGGDIKVFFCGGVKNFGGGVKNVFFGGKNFYLEGGRKTFLSLGGAKNFWGGLKNFFWGGVKPFFGGEL